MSDVLYLTATHASQGDGEGALFLCHFKRADHVGRFAASADADDDIARFDVVFHLF
jgi:hypothetical protein